MEILPLLVQPLLLIAGVALLINSTQSRFCLLEGQLQRAAANGTTAAGTRRLRQRTARHRNALASLYGAVALLCLASIAGAVLNGRIGIAFHVVIVLTCLGFIAVLYAVVVLFGASLGPIDPD